MIIQSQEELLDVVNEQDHVIGQEYRSKLYAQQATSFRVINGFLINSKNQVWIPRRSPQKKLFPLCLDASVGGHVMAGESYEQAFLRELQEELTLDPATITYRPLGKLTPHEHGVSAFMQVYAILTDEDPAYNPDDFVEGNWFVLAELRELIKKGEPTKGDLSRLIALLEDFY